MKQLKILLFCGLCGITVTSATFAYDHAQKITAEEFITRNQKDHVQEFACSCMDPRCN